MKIVELDQIVEGVTFKVQEQMSFRQRQEFMNVIEEHLDIRKIPKKKEGDTTPIKVEELPDDAIKTSPMKFMFALSDYLLLNCVVEPKITEAMLNDPDDPNTENFGVLGNAMIPIAMEQMTKLIAQKKTPSK